MATKENGNPWPDGVSLSWTPSIPGVGMVGVGGTYYWNPGSDDAPSVTLTGMYGRGVDAWKLGPPLANFNGGLVFRRSGMTSTDTLGPGTMLNISTGLPSVTVNSSIPVENGIPQLTRSKVSSIEAGVSNSIGTSAAGTYTATPQQVADAMKFIRPAMGPDDELSPFARTLQSSQGEVGPPSEPPIRYLGRRDGNALGDGMAGWTGNLPDGNMDSAAVSPNGSSGNAGGANVTPSPASPFTTGASPIPFLPATTPSKFGGLPGLMAEIGAIDPSNPDQQPAGGLAGLFAEYMRNNVAGRN